MEKPNIQKSEEKAEFIKEHSSEILPLIEKDKEEVDYVKGLVNGTNEPSDALAEKQAEDILEKFETKIFLLEKPEGEYEPNSKRVLITATDPLQFNSVFPIVKSLSKDKRCRAVGLITDNIAGKNFEDLMKEETFDFNFKAIKGGHEQDVAEPTEYDKTFPVIADGLKMVENDPFDIALVTPDKPSANILFSAKSVFGAKKLYLIDAGWVGVSGGRVDHPLRDESRVDNIDSIDGIFCNDELAKNIIINQLSEFPKEKILVTGTPVIDKLELWRAKELETEGRRKLALNEDEIAILYIGDISPDYFDKSELDRKLNEKTFSRTVEAFFSAAEREKDKKFVLLVRPHPRDPNKEELLKAVGSQSENSRIISAGLDVISINEAAYASDVVVSICSTENNLALLRGKRAVYLSYKDPGFGYDLLKIVYGDNLKIIKDQDGIDFASSPEDFKKIMEELGRSPVKETEKGSEKVNATERMINIILSN